VQYIYTLQKHHKRCIHHIDFGFIANDHHQAIMLNIDIISKTNSNKYIVVVFHQLLQHSIIGLNHKMYLLQHHTIEISQKILSRNLVSILQKLNVYL